MTISTSEVKNTPKKCKKWRKCINVSWGFESYCWHFHGVNEGKYRVRWKMVKNVVLFTSENILVDPHFVGWDEIMLQLKLNKTQSPVTANWKRLKDESESAKSQSDTSCNWLMQLPESNFATSFTCILFANYNLEDLFRSKCMFSEL